jgi:hypothetical protein
MQVQSIASLPPASLALVGGYRDFPIPRHLHRAAVLLCDLEYTAVAVDAILDHLARHGSAECCRWCDPEHRGMVEETLPMAPAAEWLVHDSVTWTATGDCAQPECGCTVCADDRAALAAWVGPGCSDDQHCDCPGCAEMRRVYEESLLLVDPSAEG